MGWGAEGAGHGGDVMNEHSKTLFENSITEDRLYRVMTSLLHVLGGTGVIRDTNRAGFVWEVYPDFNASPPRVRKHGRPHD